ncbi:MAG TPA: thioredoxin domain-containing protein [Kofleriaceae bacterium]|nr:thioredoxin domain-containing protein [Kofleriaceae bacterium]
MIRYGVVVFSLAALLGGCQQDKQTPAWDKGRDQVKPVEPRAGAAGQPSAPAGSLEERVARLERRLDKVTGFLKQAVRPELDTSVAYAVPLDPSDPVIGKSDAKVTIVEAYEYQCPYCQMVAPTVEKILEEYPNDVRVAHKYFLIHGAPAKPSGQGACAAGKQGKFAEFNKMAFAKIWPNPGQPPNKDELTAEAMERNAAALGLDVAKFKADFAGECSEWVDRSGRTLQQFGAGGTPSFYINGRFVQAGDMGAFKRVIDEEIKKVNESGVKPSEYYEKIVIGQGEKQAKMISPFDE